jgi:exopolysaccharide biosynthesis polyprenyl glycosylphosphotransferase
MTDLEIKQRLTKKFLATQTFYGRASLKISAHWKQWLWRTVVGCALVVKRGFDIFTSGLFLLIFSPLFLFLAALIKLEDGGQVFFPQIRVGRFGREFKMWKFRSMCLNAEEKLKELAAKNQHKDGVTFKIKNDPRVTKIGKWLRKFSLDELPQFYNVFIGDMSLVGPRPPVPREVALYTLADRRRLAVSPGITCFWQIGGRSEIDFSGQVQLDVRYIESQSFWLDIKILVKTVPAVLLGKGAY